MSRRDEQISFDAIVERITPDVPRFVVYPGKAWDETGTFIVDVSLNGVPIGLRSLIPWKERGWHFGLSEPMCHMVGIDTGSHVSVEMRIPDDSRPDELKELLNGDPRAKKSWHGLSSSERRDFVLFVASGKKAETRTRRARRLLLGR